MLKIKRGNGLRTSLTSVAGSLAAGKAFRVLFSLVVVTATLVGLSAMMGWSELSKSPSFLLDLRLYLLEV